LPLSGATDYLWRAVRYVIDSVFAQVRSSGQFFFSAPQPAVAPPCFGRTVPYMATIGLPAPSSVLTPVLYFFSELAFQGDVVLETQAVPTTAVRAVSASMENNDVVSPCPTPSSSNLAKCVAANPPPISFDSTLSMSTNVTCANNSTTFGDYEPSVVYTRVIGKTSEALHGTIGNAPFFAACL
jgi:hypothetical protein